MSLLSNRRVKLGIRAGGLCAALLSRWPVQRRLARVDRAWPAGTPAPAPATALAAPLEQLLTELATTAPLRGLALDVEVSDALVHLDVAAGDFAGHSEQQLESVTRACFRDLLGEAIAEHDLRWQLQADERHLLMCALPRALLDQLKTAAASHGLRLRSVHTRFQAGWNRRCALLGSGLAIFASGHDDHTVIAFVRDGVVEALSSSSCPADLEDPDAPAPGVDRLLNSLGLEKAATPTRLDA
ncbi:MAG: hypothetical protein AB9M60_12775, partial [Leptothrix sp. (in: b-proteobacteria)]